MKINHNQIGIFLILLIGIMFSGKSLRAQTSIHTIEVSNTSELIDFFKFCSIRSPLISAHRGGARIGFPENCIATFEHTLQFTSAIFEIDPRLTRDSVVVLMHDETLDRTTTGNGKVCDYTILELKELRLKDSEGNVTPYQIPTLEEVLEWGFGKTIFVLDDKGVPYELIADFLDKHNAFRYTLMTVRNIEIAKQCYMINPKFMFEAYIFEVEDVFEFDTSGIPWEKIMAYVGPLVDSGNTDLYKLLNDRKVKCMVSGALYLDKEHIRGEANVYNKIFNHGIDIIETDLPIQAAIQVAELIKKNACFFNYIGEKEIPLEEIKYISINRNMYKE